MPTFPAMPNNMNQGVRSGTMGPDHNDADEN